MVFVEIYITLVYDLKKRKDKPEMCIKVWGSRGEGRKNTDSLISLHTREGNHKSGDINKYEEESGDGD